MTNLNVIKDFLIYSAGNILLRLISAGTSFTAITFLSPQEFGLLALLNNFIAITPIFLSLGLRQGYFLEFFHLNKQQQKEMLHHLITIYLTIALPILALAIFIIPWLNQYLFLNTANSKLILTALAICFIHFFVELLLQVLRYQRNSWRLIAIQCTMATITFLGNLILVYFFQLKTFGILLANLLGMLSITLFGLFEYIKRVNKFHYPILKAWDKTTYYFSLCLPFIPNIIFYWILTSSDRWILARYANLEAVGIYSLADSFSQLFQLLILYPLSASYIPDMLAKFSAYQQDSQSKRLALESQILKLMWISMAIISIGIIFCFWTTKSIFFWLIPVKYHQARNFILILLMGQVFYMGTYFSTIKLIYLKKSRIILFTTMVAAITNIVLNITLIPRFGLYGCTWATLISFAVMFILTLFCNKIHYKNLQIEIILN